MARQEYQVINRLIDMGVLTTPEEQMSRIRAFATILNPRSTEEERYMAQDALDEVERSKEERRNQFIIK